MRRWLVRRWIVALCCVLALAGCSGGDEERATVTPLVSLDGSYVVEYDGTALVNGATGTGRIDGKVGWVFRTACDGDGCVAAGGSIVDPANPTAPLQNPRVADYLDGRWTMVNLTENSVSCTGPGGEKLTADGWAVWDIGIADDMTLAPTVTTIGTGDCPSVSVATPTMTRVGDPLPDFPAPDPAAQPAREVPAAAAFRGEYTVTTTRRGQPARAETDRRDVVTNCLRSEDRCVTTAVTPGAPGAVYAELSVYESIDGAIRRESVSLPWPCEDDASRGFASESETLVLPTDAAADPLPTLTGELVRTFTTVCPGVAEYDVAYAVAAA